MNRKARITGTGTKTLRSLRSLRFHLNLPIDRKFRSVAKKIIKYHFGIFAFPVVQSKGSEKIKKSLLPGCLFRFFCHL